MTKFDVDFMRLSLLLPFIFAAHVVAQNEVIIGPDTRYGKVRSQSGPPGYAVRSGRCV
ncbi:MAG: hypothetical protein WEB37_13225 [Bacteroidota bacterium]